MVGAALHAAACQFGDDPQGQALCGDAHLDVGEGCDDGNLTGGDGCSANCAIETARPVCGNGMRESSEGCDDGNTRNGDGCSATCVVETPTAVCGNGTLETGEGCDDGNRSDGDGCSATCQVQAVNCTLVPNGGCPNGLACDVDDQGERFCRTKGTGVAESSCASVEDCNAGLSCVDYGNGTSYCMRYCEANSDCNGAGAACVITLNDNNGNAIEDATVCTYSCQPVGGAGCPNGLGCYLRELGAADATTCLPEGNRADGQSCVRSSECLGGSTCVGNICRRTCSVNAPNCPAGRFCSGLTPALMVGSTEFGACL